MATGVAVAAAVGLFWLLSPEPVKKAQRPRLTAAARIPRQPEPPPPEAVEVRPEHPPGQPLDEATLVRVERFVNDFLGARAEGRREELRALIDAEAFFDAIERRHAESAKENFGPNIEVTGARRTPEEIAFTGDMIAEQLLGLVDEEQADFELGARVDRAERTADGKIFLRLVADEVRQPLPVRGITSHGGALETAPKVEEWLLVERDGRLLLADSPPLQPLR